MFTLLTDDQVRKNDIDTLKRWLRQKLGGYTVAIKNITTDNILYRGVPWPDRPHRVTELSYPPVAFARLNRANRAGQPMFYGSRGAPPVFYESRAGAGDRIALSGWNITQPIWMHNLGFHQDALRKLGGPNVPLRTPFVDPIPNETRENEKMRRAMSRAFTEVIEPDREYRYKRTVAITELLFDKAEPIPQKPDGPSIPRAGGIVYPAMQMRGAADNVALWPDFVDRCMAVTLALYVLVEQADPQSSSYTLLTLAKADAFPDGNINWREPDGPEWKRRSHVTFENGQWVSRDGSGQVYDRH